jgi:hypothetical protein
MARGSPSRRLPPVFGQNDQLADDLGQFLVVLLIEGECDFARSGDFRLDHMPVIEFALRVVRDRLLETPDNVPGGDRFAIMPARALRADGRKPRSSRPDSGRLPPATRNWRRSSSSEDVIRVSNTRLRPTARSPFAGTGLSVSNEPTTTGSACRLWCIGIDIVEPLETPRGRSAPRPGRSRAARQAPRSIRAIRSHQCGQHQRSGEKRLIIDA